MSFIDKTTPDSPESTTRQHDSIPTIGHARSLENMVDSTRSVQFLGVARVDDPEAMSKRLAEDVTNESFKLLVNSSVE
jgi:hypothetical protein